MAGPTMIAKVTGDAIPKLHQLGHNAVNARPALNAAMRDVQAETNRLWTSRRKPLKPETLERKRRKGQPSTPGVATGATQRATHPIKAAATNRSLKITVRPPQAGVSFDTRPVMPSNTRIVGLTMHAIYEHLDVDKVSVRYS